MHLVDNAESASRIQLILAQRSNDNLNVAGKIQRENRFLFDVAAPAPVRPLSAFSGFRAVAPLSLHVLMTDSTEVRETISSESLPRETLRYTKEKSQRMLKKQMGRGLNVGRGGYYYH